MVKDAMDSKIKQILDNGKQLTEDHVRSAMILLRKELELVSEQESQNFLVLNLFCNWSAHTEITQSNTGLRILAKINDALVRVKDATDAIQIRAEISRAVGLNEFRNELLAFLDKLNIENNLNQEDEWMTFLHYLLEIIRDVPVAFPPLGTLSKKAGQIYAEIQEKPIKVGAGVIQVQISQINYSDLGVEGGGLLWCLLIRTEDTTTTVIPLLIELN